MGTSAWTLVSENSASETAWTPVSSSSSSTPKDYAIQPQGVGPLAAGLTKSQAAAITSAFPAAGATLGGLLGEGWASIPAAALGGAGGKALQQLTNRWLGAGNVPETSLDAAKDIGIEGAEQGSMQGAGLGIAKAASAVAPALAESAGRTISKVFSPTKQADKALIAKSVPRLLDEKPIALSRSSLLKKTGDLLDESGKSLDAALASVPPGTKVPLSSVQSIADSMDRGASAFMAKDIHGNSVPIPGSEAAIGTFHDLKNFVSSMDPSFENVRTVRQVLDNLVDSGGKWNMTGAEASQKEIQRQAANELRAALADSGGDAFKKANSDYSFYKGLQTVLEHTQERMTGQQGNLTRRILSGAGAVAGAHGGPGGMVTGATAMNLLSRAMDSTAWRTVNAATKSSIADMLANDEIEKVAPILVRVAAEGTRGESQ